MLCGGDQGRIAVTRSFCGDDHNPMPNAKPVPLILPFSVGCLLLLIVLLVVAFGDDPTPLQYTIYRIVIAIGGAAFAVALTGGLK